MSSLPSGTKLPTEYENPLDKLLFKIASPLVDVCHSVGLTPNDVTAVSFAAGVFSLHFFRQLHPGAAVACWSLNYLCDTIDGMFARRYDMETPFGDMFDHVTDVVTYAGVFGIATHKVLGGSPWVPLAVGAALALCAVGHMTCQEAYVKDAHQKVAMLNAGWCSDPTNLSWTRFVGVGTLNLYLMFMIWFYCKRV